MRNRILIVLTMLLGQYSYLEAQTEATATYNVRFVATWSQASHPQGFPSNPHFSGLIGAVHSSDVTFWMPKSLASDGIESMAETGSKSALQAEIETSIAAGQAVSVVSGGGIGRSPGMVEITIQLSRDFPLLTLVSMLAPSPDWFVGVSSMPMTQNGEWIQFAEVNLEVYDAGTDSGPNYTSANSDTDPAAPIDVLTSAPFNQSNIVGRFEIRRQQIVGTRAELPAGLSIEGPYPNPTSSRFTVTAQGIAPFNATVEIVDVLGQRLYLQNVKGSYGDAFTIERSVNGWTPGPYFVRIAGNGFVWIRPLIVY